MRRILASDPDPEQRLESLLAERRQEIEEQAARLQDAVRDLERREQLLRDSRASLERLLRMGTSDLESREAELAQLLREVTEREERVTAAETDLARRREELGAVELKRAAVERREHAVAEREEKLAEQDAEAPTWDASDTALLAFVPGSEYRIRELAAQPLRAGDDVLLDDDEYVVARTGPSPLPGDSRRCAYLVRAPRGERAADGSR